MPIVSVNLNEEAYILYLRHKEHRDGSRFISAAVINYGLKDEYMPLLKHGDRRISVTGQELVWSEGNGWVVVEE